MNWTVGTQVTHPAKPEWGLGRIVSVSAGEKLRVKFKNGGERLLKGAPLVVVAKGDPTKWEPAAMKGGLPIGEYKEAFLDRFPNGFYDERYLAGERRYKVEARELLRTTLGKKKLKSLLDRGDFEEVCRLAIATITATNLIFPNEKMALTDALKEATARERFGKSLFQLLYGQDSPQDRVVAFGQVLAGLDAARWTTATYFLYLADPDTQMFMKAVRMKHIAAACNVELNYKTAINELTYRSLLKVTERLREELADMRPRDNIDIQSFIWCVA